MKPFEPEGVIGQPHVRLDGAAKVTGAARYGDDDGPVGAAHGHLHLSAIARGWIATIDAAAALTMPGVLLVLTHENVGKAIRPGKWFLDNGYMQTAIAPLRDATIHHAGQIVALVVAETSEIARAAADALAIRYEADTPIATMDDARAASVKPRSFNETELAVGDVERGLASADVTMTADYATPLQHNNPMELFQATCAWDGDDLTVWESTQNVRGLQYGLAKQLGIRPKHIRVLSRFVGGAFGSRGELGQMTAIVAHAARRLDRPVRLVATRRQGFTLRTARAETRQHIRLGATRDGRLTALEHLSEEATSRLEPFVAAGSEATARLYACPNINVKVRAVGVDRHTPGFMRAPAELPYVFPVECAMDELAWSLDLDPLELRRCNETDVDPVSGLPFTARPLLACMEAGAEAFGWDERDPRPGTMRDGDWLVGYGYATASKPAMMAPADVTVTLDREGRASVLMSTHEIGNGIVTVLAITVADRLGLRVEAVAVNIGDSRLPASPVTAASNTTASLCTVVVKACDSLRARLVKGAVGDRKGALAGQHADFVRFRDGMLEAGGVSEPLATAVRRAGRGRPLVARATHNPHGVPPVLGPILVRRGVPIVKGGTMLKDRMQFSFGSQFAEVRVNRYTGEIRVPRLVGAFAAGRIVNPLTARSQLEGGMIFGLSSAIMEETVIDPRTAAYVNDDLAEYHVPVAADVGHVQAIMIDEPDTGVNAPGIKGLGEVGVTGVPPAVANAVYHATGVRVRSFPIRLDMLLEHLPPI